MPKALNVDWLQIETDYRDGKGSCRELAIKYGLKPKTVTNRCHIHKWTKDLNKVIEETVREKVINTLVDERLEKIKALEEKSYRVSDKLITSVELSHDAMPDGLLDPSMIATLANGLKVSVAVARQSLRMVDAVAVDVSTGGMSLHASSLAILESCKKLVSNKQVDAASIDVDGLLLELKQSET